MQHFLQTTIFSSNILFLSCQEPVTIATRQKQTWDELQNKHGH